MPEIVLAAIVPVFRDALYSEPDTSSLYPGLVWLMPTLPLFRMVMRSALVELPNASREVPSAPW